MCVIIDANIVGFFITKPNDPKNKPIYNWLFKGDGRIVYGGKNKVEILTNSGMKRLIFKLQQAGRAISIIDSKIDKAEKEINRKRVIKSNDSHVLALAISSGARTLYSCDAKLGSDFKNGEIINNPRGRVYKGTSKKHSSLLKHDPCCKANSR